MKAFVQHVHSPQKIIHDSHLVNHSQHSIKTIPTEFTFSGQKHTKKTKSMNHVRTNDTHQVKVTHFNIMITKRNKTDECQKLNRCIPRLTVPSGFLFIL